MIRMNIGAYIIDEKTKEAFVALKGDIALTRSTVSVFDGGIEKAIENLKISQENYDLIVVQTNSDAESKVLDEIERLSHYVSSDAKVILISNINDVHFYKKIIEMGISEYVNLPVDKNSMIKSIRSVCESDQLVERGKIISFIGAKGGVGSSFICHNIAKNLAEKSKRPTTLVDMDIFFGTVGINFHQETRYGLRDAINKKFQMGVLDNESIEQIVFKENDYLWLLASNPSLDFLDDSDDDTIDEVIDAIARTTKFMFLDIPHLWNPTNGNILLNSDEIFIITEPSLPSLRNTQLLFETLFPKKMTGTNINYIVNMAGVDKNTDISLKNFEESLGMLPISVIPYNPSVVRSAISKGQMLTNTKKSKEIINAFQKIEDNIFTQEKEKKKQSGIDNFLEKIKKRFQK